MGRSCAKVHKPCLRNNLRQWYQQWDQDKNRTHHVTMDWVNSSDSKLYTMNSSFQSYGIEFWTLRAEEEQLLNVFDRRFCFIDIKFPSWVFVICGAQIFLFQRCTCFFKLERVGSHDVTREMTVFSSWCGLPSNIVSFIAKLQGKFPTWNFTICNDQILYSKDVLVFCKLVRIGSHGESGKYVLCKLNYHRTVYKSL